MELIHLELLAVQRERRLAGRPRRSAQSIRVSCVVGLGEQPAGDLDHGYVNGLVLD